MCQAKYVGTCKYVSDGIIYGTRENMQRLSHSTCITVTQRNHLFGSIIRMYKDLSIAKLK